MSLCIRVRLVRRFSATYDWATSRVSLMKGRILRPEQLPEVCSRDNIIPDLVIQVLWTANITRAGLVRLRFRVKGAGPEEVKID